MKKKTPDAGDDDGDDDDVDVDDRLFTFVGNLYLQKTVE